MDFKLITQRTGGYYEDGTYDLKETTKQTYWSFTPAKTNHTVSTTLHLTRLHQLTQSYNLQTQSLSERYQTESALARPN